MDHLSFRFAIGKLTRLGREQQASTLQALESAAEEALRGPDPQQACAAIRALLQRRPRMARWWKELGTLLLREGRLDEAREAMHHAIHHAGHHAPLLHRIGRDLVQAGIDACALSAHPPQAAALQADFAPWPEGTRDRILGDDLAGALSALESTYLMTGSLDGHARNLAFAYRALGDEFRAQCVEAGKLLARRDAAGAVALFESLDRSPLLAGAHLDWKYLNALRYVGQDDRLFEAAQANRASMSSRAWLQWSEALLDANQDEQAAQVLAEAAERFDDGWLRLRPCTDFPAVPLDGDVVNRSLTRVRATLDELEARPLPADQAELSALADALAPNFHLSYQIDDETDLLRLARLTARVVRAELPQYAGPRCSNEVPGKRRIRIGYAASVVRFQTIVGYFINWFREADRERFELHLFPLEEDRDALTGYVEQYFDVCHPPLIRRDQAAERIANADIDILVYLEVGMSRFAHALSSLRLAPIQCLAAGHPMTSGMDSIDYFLSPASMEPEDGQAHYSERLERLPGVGICMPVRRDPTPGKTRADFDLSGDQVVFTSPQSLWKYRPGDEHAYARVVAGMDNAVMLFVDEGMPARTRTFATRLHAACDAAGVDFDARMRILPRHGYGDYLAKLALCDVFLDSFHWSGGVTTFDALALGVPVVTLPGTRMRGRQSYGMLKEMGIEDTIAEDVDDYVRIARGLGKDAAWRQDVSARIKAAHPRLFDDTRSIKALEAFYLRCVDAKACE